MYILYRPYRPTVFDDDGDDIDVTCSPCLNCRFADIDEDDGPDLLRSELDTSVAKLRKKLKVLITFIQAAISAGVEILFELC